MPEETRGRPSAYTPEIAKLICEQLADGATLRQICRAEGMPAESTVRAWAIEDREGFSAQYAKAREIGYHSMADEIIDIADDGRNDWIEREGEEGQGWAVNGEHLNRSRLRVDTRKWLVSKALPKIYGDKVSAEISGPNGTELIPDIRQTARAVMALFRAAQAKGETSQG